jgi:hypothetical protein
MKGRKEKKVNFWLFRMEQFVYLKSNQKVNYFYFSFAHNMGTIFVLLEKLKIKIHITFWTHPMDASKSPTIFPREK